MGRNESEWSWIAPDLPRSHDRSVSAPAIQLDDHRAPISTARSELSSEQPSEASVMSRDAQLPPVLHATQQIYQPEQVDVVQTLQRVVEHGYGACRNDNRGKG